MDTHNPYFGSESLSQVPNGATFLLFETEDEKLKERRIEKKHQGQSGILCEVLEGPKKHSVLKLAHDRLVKEVEDD